MHFDAITYSLLKDRKLRNVAPLCTITTSDWTGSTSGEVLFTGDGTTKDFSGKVDLPPVNPLDSFVLHYTIGGTTYDATADSDGNITGEHITSGTINQDGTYEIHFDTPPDDTTDGTADYNYGIEPANIERVLDPVNPQPSDWGWFSSDRAKLCGKLYLTPPYKGIYLVVQVVEFYTVRGGSKLNLGYSLVSGKDWRYVKTPMGYIYLDSPGRCHKPEICEVRKDEIFEKAAFYVNCNGAGEFKWRWWSIKVFFIGNL